MAGADREKKNVSNIVQFRFIKRSDRSVPFCFVYAPSQWKRRSSDGLAIPRAGLRPLSIKASRGFSS